MLQEIEKKLLTLTAQERAKAIQILTKTIGKGAPGIDKVPGVCGGDACIIGTRIPVWSLVNYRRLNASDGDILEAFPDLSAADLVNAWAYADAYPEEIDKAIKENESMME